MIEDYDYWGIEYDSHCMGKGLSYLKIIMTR